MSGGTDGNVTAWEKLLGAKAMGVSGIPVWGRAARNELRHDAVVGRLHHEVVEASERGSAVPRVPALAQGAQGLVRGDRRVPADKRFPASLVTDPIAKQLLALDQSAVSVWPENFVPPQVDGNADLAAGELITSGSGSPADAVKLWKSELKKWKTQHPDEFQ